MNWLSTIYIGMMIGFIWDLLWVHTNWKSTLIVCIVLTISIFFNEYIISQKEQKESKIK